MAPPVTQGQRPLLAAAWMGGSVLSFTAMAIAGRSVSGVHDTFEILLWRSIIGLGLVLLVASATGQRGAIRTDRLPQHILRNIVHFTGQNLWFWSLTAIPLAQVFALEFTSPIWVILLSPLLLGERLTARRIGFALVGFLGTMIVAHPDFGSLNPGVLAAAASAICFAVSILLTKRLTRGESIVSILFWLTLIQAIFGLLAAGWDGQITLPTAQTLPWLAVIGAAGVFAHLCLTTALTLAPASVVVPVDFARLPLIAVLGAVLYNETIDPAVILGGAVIFAANWMNIRSERPRP